MTTVVWRLYNASTQEQLIDLDLSGARLARSKIPPLELDAWFAWQEGWADWVKVAEVKELEPELTVSRPPVPPPPPALPALPIQASAVIETIPENRRKHPRHPVRIKVIIEMDGRTFRTYTRDASRGGLLIQDHLPWEATSESCHVYLASPEGKESLEFKSRIVVDLKNPKRIAFEDAPEDFLDKLESWITRLSTPGSRAA